jgi:anti-anti-sigma regulatory factor
MIFASGGSLPRVSRQSRADQVVYLDATDLDPDLVTLDMLARFALQLRRRGARVVLRGVSGELLELIELAGLSDALPADPLRPDSTPPRC